MHNHHLASLTIALAPTACSPVKLPTAALSSTHAPTQFPLDTITYDSDPTTRVVYAD